MCHFISCNNKREFFISFQQIHFVGKKKFFVDENYIYGYYTNSPYILTLDDNDIVFSDIEEVREQEIIFYLPVKDIYDGRIFEKDFAWTNKIRAGLHIAPLNSKDRLPEYCGSVLIIPVKFFICDLLFYDGNNASVKKFKILHPEKIKKYRINENIAEFDENTYKQIYEFIFSIYEQQQKIKESQKWRQN